VPMNARIKVMYLNPVGTSAYDEVFADMARQYKCPGTEVHIASLNPDSVAPEMNNLEYRAYESLIVADTVKAARQAALDGFDAMAIGCFYDPAVLDAREISGETAIVGPCQASITAALNVANNFSIIIGRTKWEDQMKQAVHEYGYGTKLASFETAGLRVEEFHRNPAETRNQLELAAVRAVEESKAEAIILGCTLEVGFFAELQEFLRKRYSANVPVIDCSIAALKAAESAAWQKRIGWTNSRVWGMEPPPESELERFGIFRGDYKFGNLINVPAE